MAFFRNKEIVICKLQYLKVYISRKKISYLRLKLFGPTKPP
jgi:hypothetical protein